MCTGVNHSDFVLQDTPPTFVANVLWVNRYGPPAGVAAPARVRFGCVPTLVGGARPGLPPVETRTRFSCRRDAGA